MKRRLQFVLLLLAASAFAYAPEPKFLCPNSSFQYNQGRQLGYAAAGRQTAATNAADEVARQFWNARGESTKSVDNANRSVLSAFDAAGNQIILTNRNGKLWQFQFDAANRLTNTLTPLGRQTQITYNQRGLVSTVREPSGQMTTNYFDAKGRLTNRVDGVASTVYRYDANDNVTNIIENGKTNAWTFDAYDRVSSYRDADGNLIQYRFDASGNLTNLIYPGGKTVVYFFDSLNRLTNVTDWAGRKTTFTYDLASRLTNVTRPNGAVRTINYDAGDQTTNVWERTVAGVPITMFKLAWNNAARMDWEFTAPLPHPYTPPSRSMTFDDDNRIATYNGEGSIVSHDEDGNMLTGPVRQDAQGTGIGIFMYDARNRLTLGSGTYCGYDPAGQRTAVTNAVGGEVTRFVINPNAALSQVLLRVKNGVTNYYVYGAGLLYEVTESGGITNTLYYHYDYRGSTVALTDGNGNITDRIEYSAYGMTTYRAGTNDTPFLYNGCYGVQTDLGGPLYMRARYYNPLLCRFLNTDPSGFSGGLNFYTFADGNPISMIDPFGLGAMGDSGGSSWLNQIGSALGYDNSYAAQDRREQALTGFANVASFGLANDVTSATTGYDLYGNRQTRTERGVAGTMAAMSFIPIDRVAFTGARLALGTAERAVWRVGRHGDMPTPRIFGTQSHHGVNSVWMAANMPSYSAVDAPAILMQNDPFHNATRGVFNRMRSEIATRQGVSPRNVDWSQVSPGTAWRLAEEQLQAAQAPANIQAEYFRQFNQYLETLR